MIQVEQLEVKVNKTYTSAIAVCVASSIILLAAVLHLLGMSPVPLLLAIGVGLLIWQAYKHTVGCVGSFLAFMPFFPVAFMLAEFVGPSYIAKMEGIDRAVLLLLTFFLLLQRGIRLVLPDWLLLIAFGIALMRLPLDGSPLALAADFGFIIPYFAGRMVDLNPEQQAKWARRATWLLAISSVLGLVEVLGIGEGPRTLLYLAVAPQFTDEGGGLNAAFHAHGYPLLREAAFMQGALQFAPLCMVALIIWWVYSRKPLPGSMIVIGLIATVTRSAWVGAAMALAVLSLAMGQKKRLIGYGMLLLVLFASLIPILGLQDYLSENKQGEDPSAGLHQTSMMTGIIEVASHPLGEGSANIGRQAMKDNESATYFECAYLTLAGGYGIPVVACILGFMFSAFHRSWRMRSKLGFAAMGILAGFGTALIFVSAHDVFPLAAWVWIPVGQAVKASTSKS